MTLTPHHAHPPDMGFWKEAIQEGAGSEIARKSAIVMECLKFDPAGMTDSRRCIMTRTNLDSGDSAPACIKAKVPFRRIYS